MSKILYPIFNLPNENNEENEAVPTWIKWWLLNNYKKSHSWILSEILTGNPLTLENSVETKFYLPPLPRGNSKQDGTPSPTNEVSISNVTGDVEVLVQNKNLFDEEYYNNSSLYAEGASGTRYFRYVEMPDSFKTSFYGNVFLKGTSQNLVAGFSTSQTGATDRMLSGGTITNNVHYDFTNAEHVYFVIGNSSGVDASRDVPILFNNYNIQVTKETASTYTPHKEQTFTFPLGTQRMYLGDYLADDGIHHVRKQVVWNGNNIDWALRTEGSTEDFAVFRQLDYIANTYKSIKLCDYFQIVSVFDETSNNIRLVNINSYGTNVVISKDIVTNVDEFKTWLSTHNVTVEYELSTEEITPYTEPQQTAYDEIKQAISYEEQTNISGTSDEADPIFEVQYYMTNESEGENESESEGE